MTVPGQLSAGQYKFPADSPLFAALFDPAWYLGRYPDAVRALDENQNLTPLDHYLREGLADGRIATPFFDAEWYLSAYPDVRRIVTNAPSRYRRAIEHYLTIGCHESRDPNPIFDEAWYAARYDNPKQRGPYVNNYHHFLAEGAASGLSPSPLFDEAWYRRQYKDTATAIAQGLLPSGYHDYLRRPIDSERSPCPYFDVEQAVKRHPLEAANDQSTPALRLAYFDFLTSGAPGGRNPSLHFDESWYLATHPAVRAAVAAGTYRSGYHHYLYEGIELDYDPNPYFNGKWYSGWYPEVAESLARGEYRSAFEHYVCEGAAAGLNPNLYFQERWYTHNNLDLREARRRGQIASGHAHYLKLGYREGRAFSTIFDPEWYRRTYPEVDRFIESGLVTCAYDHFCRYGQTLGFNTCPDFDEGWYLTQYPDVRTEIRDGKWLCGLHHFIVKGLNEGRLAKPGLKADNPERNLTVTALARHELRHFLARGETLVCNTDAQPVVSILLVHYNRAELTLRCLQSIVRWADIPYEIVAVDNASTDETEAMMARVRGIRVIRNRENLQFLRASNQAAAAAQGKYLLLFNNDVELQAGALSSSVNLLAANPDIGAVGGKIILYSGVLQEAGCYLLESGWSIQYGRGQAPFRSEYMHRRDVPYCSGAFLMTPAALFAELGGFDEAFLPIYCEDADYCLRLWEKGFRVAFNPASMILHHEGAASRHARFSEASALRHIAILRARYKDHLATVPDYSVAPVSSRDGWSMRPACLVIVDDLLTEAANGTLTDVLTRAAGEGFFVSLYPLKPWIGERAELGATVPDDVEVVAEQGLEQLEEFCKQRSKLYRRVIVLAPEEGGDFQWLHRWLEGVEIFT
jgi:GT2 family glycosyltransferase